MNRNIEEYNLIDTVKSEMQKSLKIIGDISKEVNIDCSSELQHCYDELILGAILRNLFLNALKHADKRVSIKVYSSIHSGVEFVVDNDGGPITDELIIDLNAHLGEQNTIDKGFGVFLIKTLLPYLDKNGEAAILVFSRDVELQGLSAKHSV